MTEERYELTIQDHLDASSCVVRRLAGEASEKVDAATRGPLAVLDFVDDWTLRLIVAAIPLRLAVPLPADGALAGALRTPTA